VPRFRIQTPYAIVAMKFEKTLHVGLNELRVQMLGTQVLFGFQLEGVFQERFASASEEVRFFSCLGLCCIVATLALLIAAPCQHRLVERGLPTHRIFRVASRFANLALLPFGIALEEGTHAGSRISDRSPCLARECRAGRGWRQRRRMRH
jgi:hypothetical protein